MNIEQLKSLSAEDRRLVLQSEASSIEEGKYTKPLDEDEIRSYKDELADLSIKQAIILDEFASIKEEFKLRLKPLAQGISSALQAVKFKAIDQDGKLYLIQDFESNMVHKVDELGNVILSRQMRPEERQYFMKPSNAKTA